MTWRCLFRVVHRVVGEQRWLSLQKCITALRTNPFYILWLCTHLKLHYWFSKIILHISFNLETEDSWNKFASLTDHGNLWGFHSFLFLFAHIELPQPLIGITWTLLDYIHWWNTAAWESAYCLPKVQPWHKTVAEDYCSKTVLSFRALAVTYFIWSAFINHAQISC